MMTHQPIGDTDVDLAVKAYQAVMDTLGIVGDDRTAQRYVNALIEFVGGDDPADHLAVQFTMPRRTSQLVAVANVPFTSLCSHHLLPFWGSATIAYLPSSDGPVVGLSKLPRALRAVASRPQLQETIGDQLADAIMDSGTLRALGAGVRLTATHACMALRGAATGPDTTMVTTVYRGQLATNPYRDEFSAIAG